MKHLTRQIQGKLVGQHKAAALTAPLCHQSNSTEQKNKK